jgi:hypothetical protein
MKGKNMSIMDNMMVDEELIDNELPLIRNRSTIENKLH